MILLMALKLVLSLVVFRASVDGAMESLWSVVVNRGKTREFVGRTYC